MMQEKEAEGALFDLLSPLLRVLRALRGGNSSFSTPAAPEQTQRQGLGRRACSEGFESSRMPRRNQNVPPHISCRMLLNLSPNLKRKPQTVLDDGRALKALATGSSSTPSGR